MAQLKTALRCVLYRSDGARLRTRVVVRSMAGIAMLQPGGLGVQGSGRHSWGHGIKVILFVFVIKLLFYPEVKKFVSEF
jgi:hypothetical protein